ncbi:TonB-dependent receptor [Pedobacter nutrimenti]|jgi:outer membrane receptor protein involved in Fe transport|uniref:Carboxypeptidase family protein n=1 Tax=Pedobacter nutrimenti TaxID=1241337 RepID=A0A318UBT2_9SPHI|nr:carboxypeptidase regulatory-like domain-containing protein [Pedobacter nutrimenti]PYF72692.1 carboxypeptidase family protein [Pedobacter nutrimenti]
MNKSLLFKIVVIVIAFVGSFSASMAQITTSSVTGIVKDAKGPLPGASIKARHMPTGTVYGITTNNDGRFTLGNMGVGGPYVIEVSFVGYQPKKIEGVYLKLGEPFVVNATLSDNSSNLNEVTIVGTSANAILNSNKNGSSTIVSRQQIQSLPTISRSINDITRLNPQSNGTSIAGGNYRSNNFTVDGSNFNNMFGIGSNVPANGAPISIDALEQISVNVTPYDVRQSGFTGGAVNAVTRSGSNDFSATAFYLMRNQDQQGTKIGDYTITNVQPFTQKQYGASLGGPIIKNKLFFFANVEFNKQNQPGQPRIASSAANPFGSSDNVARPTASFLDGVRSYLMSKYGYDPGQYQGYQQLSNNDKLLFRLDWNISKNHRFNIRYNQVESKTPSNVSTSRSPFTNYTTGIGRTDKNALWFNNSNYYQAANLYSWAAELNSQFGNKFTNVLRGSYSHQNDPRSSDSAVFPFVDILDNGQPLTSFGYEPFTFGNLRDVKNYSITDNFNMALGKHNVTLGAQLDFNTTQNGFQRFGTSYYTFNSWNDFITGANPRDFGITYSLSPGYEQAFPTFKFNTYSAYIQDEFTATDRLKFTVGVRAEQFTYPSVPQIQQHPLLNPLTFANGEKLNTGILPSNRILWSPRFGFNWDIKGDRSLQLRGGSGIFRGTVPFVWVVAQSGDAGLIQFTQTSSGANVPGPFNPDPRAYLPKTPPAAGTALPNPISTVSPNFKAPQTWKSNLALDFKLPGDIVATVEGIYSKDINAAIARNANLVNPTALNSPGYPDHRPFYPAANKDKFINPLTSAGLPVANGAANGTGAFNTTVLDNAKGGYYWSATAQLTKQFRGGLSAMVAYTHSDARNFGDGAGDQLINLWSIPQTSGNPNNPSLSYTSNVVPDRVVASLSYRKEYLKNLATTVSLFYTGSIQDRSSYVYSADFNRDGQANDLIYIPKSPSEITFDTKTITVNGVSKTFTPQQQSDAFFAYVAQDKYLSKHQGEYAERNGIKFPWLHRVDLKIVQEVFRNVGGKKNSFQFTADILNFTNLINKNWGTLKRLNAASILQPSNVSDISATVAPKFRLADFNGDLVRSTFSDNQTISSTYYMQFGVRYNFN